MAVLNPLELDGSTILVTGASSGIGRETSILLSRLGARLVLSGRDGDALGVTREQLQGTGHQVAAFDLHLIEKLPAWLKTVTAESGALSGLVHCAGMHAAMPVRVLGPGKSEQMMKLNVLAAMQLIRGFRQPGCYQPNSSIVLLSSAAGLVGSAGLAAYSATKAALIGMVRSVAVELAPDSIRVNCVAPGMVRTEMFARYAQSITEEQLSKIEARHPLGFGEPGDVANAVAFLLAKTGRWITGSTLVVDGGYSAGG